MLRQSNFKYKCKAMKMHKQRQCKYRVRSNSISKLYGRAKSNKQRKKTKQISVSPFKNIVLIFF